MKKDKSSKIIYIFIIIFLMISFGFPILSLINMVDTTEITQIITSNQFIEPLKNSMFISSITTIITIIIAYIVSYGLNKAHFKHKNTIILLLSLTMLIPSISHGVGLINIFGQAGVLYNLFGINISIYGPIGIVLGSFLYAFPIAFVIINDGFKYIQTHLYESANVLGLTKFQQFKNITLYYMKRPLLSASFAIFTMVFTDYGVPMILGGTYQTLPVYLYREVIGLMDYSKGAIIGIVLLCPALVSFIFDLFNKEENSQNKIPKNTESKKDKKKYIFSKTVIYSIIVFELILIISYIVLAFYNNYPVDKSFSLVHFANVFDTKSISFLKNSLIIAISTSILGTIITYITAYVTSRSNMKYKKILHILSISTLAVPGMVLGISFIISYKGTFIYNTMFILILVNIIHFFATPYLLAYNSLSKINKNYESIGMIMGVKKSKIVKDIIIPNTKKTILEMFSYIFINSMITISAITFLYSYDNMPFSLLINQYDGQMMLEEAAIVSIVILGINIILKIIILKINQRGETNDN